jgi:hypothetical protein
MRGIAAAVSTVVSLAIFQLWVGISNYGIFPPAEGSMLNDVMRIVAIPFVLLVIVGGGLAAAYALSTDALSDRQRLWVVLTAPPGILWISAFGWGLGGAPAAAVCALIAAGFVIRPGRGLF